VSLLVGELSVLYQNSHQIFTVNPDGAVGTNSNLLQRLRAKQIASFEEFCDHEKQYMVRVEWDPRFLLNKVQNAVSLELPCDLQRNLSGTRDSAMLSVLFTTALSDAIIDWGGRAHSTGLKATLLTMWLVFIARLTGQESVTVAVGENLQNAHFGGNVGHLYTTCFLTHAPLANKAPRVISDLLFGRCSMKSLHAPQFSMNAAKSRAVPKRNAGYPFAQAGFWCDTETESPWSGFLYGVECSRDFPGLILKPVVSHNTNDARQSSLFDIALHVFETNGRFGVAVEYLKCLIKPETEARWLGSFVELVGSFVNETTSRTAVHQLSMLPADQQKYLVETLNDTRATFDSAELLKYGVAHFVQPYINSDNLAVCMPEVDGTRLTYR